ncbi:hypothetical protein HY627_01485 [Candidatus Uhrbacteria bacterium]|nr:hypothetical protein [Candidatus Uhrbacteria bacterium]
MHNSPQKHAIFIVLFAALGFGALQIPLAHLAGSKTAFTLFDAFAPVTGALLGMWTGIIAVAAMQIANFIVHGSTVLDAGTIIRFFPMLFAVAVFSKKSRLNLIVPFLAIAAFLAHPIGRMVWYFSLFWTIPLIAHHFRDRFLFARALGATFTAHAVGGALWIWAFALPASVWKSLIPVVITERSVFAVGICASYYVLVNALAMIQRLSKKSLGLPLHPAFLIPSLRANATNTES